MGSIAIDLTHHNVWKGFLTERWQVDSSLFKQAARALHQHVGGALHIAVVVIVDFLLRPGITLDLNQSFAVLLVFSHQLFHVLLRLADDRAFLLLVILLFVLILIFILFTVNQFLKPAEGRFMTLRILSALPLLCLRVARLAFLFLVNASKRLVLLCVGGMIVTRACINLDRNVICRLKRRMISRNYDCGKV